MTKPKYIIETTAIDLIPCKDKKELMMKMKMVKKYCNDCNVKVFDQKQFKEEYGKDYK